MATITYTVSMTLHIEVEEDSIPIAEMAELMKDELEDKLCKTVEMEYGYSFTKELDIQVGVE